MLRENVAIPHLFLFSSFFSSFSCTLGLKQFLAVTTVVSTGSGRSLNLRERGTFLSNWRNYGLKRVEQIPLLYFSLSFSIAHPGPWLLTQSWEVHSRVCVMKPSFLLEGLKRGVLGNQKVAGKPLKAAYGLLSWLPSFACVSLILNSIRKCWARNYGIDHPPIPKLGTMWDSYETLNWIEIGNTTHRRHVRTWSMNPTGSITGLKKTPKLNKHVQWDLNNNQSFNIILKMSQLKKNYSAYKESEKSELTWEKKIQIPMPTSHSC